MEPMLSAVVREDLAQGRFSRAFRAVDGAIQRGHIREMGLLDLYRSFLLRKVGGLPSIGVESPGDEAAPPGDPEIPWLENERVWVLLHYQPTKALKRFRDLCERASTTATQELLSVKSWSFVPAGRRKISVMPKSVRRT